MKKQYLPKAHSPREHPESNQEEFHEAPSSNETVAVQNNSNVTNEPKKPKHKGWAESPHLPAKKSKPVIALVDEEKKAKSNSNGDHHPQIDQNTDSKRQNNVPRGNSNNRSKYTRNNAPYFKRSWKVVSEQSRHPPENTFEVVSYNALADSLVKKSELYPYCPEWVLEWNTRRERLLDEFKHLNADIFCLQEIVDFEYFEKELSNYGYKGLFKKRTGENSDGCATFWKNSKFSLVDSQLLEFNQVANGIAWMDRDNVAQVLILKLLGGDSKDLKAEESSNEKSSNASRLICMLNTHLLFNPKRGDLKLAQIKLLFNSVDSLFF